MLEFKLQYYFEKYKDTSIVGTAEFKDNFKKEHGDFVLLPELINMIIKYQIKKYGELVTSGKSLRRIVKKNKYNTLEMSRNYSRFGTKEERERRKRNYRRK